MIDRFVIGLAGLLGSTGIASAEIIWGINGHPITAYPGIDIATQLDLIEDLGMRSYRVNVPDAGSADTIAALVEEGRARGIDILPVLTPGDISLETDSVEQIYDATRQLAIELGTRFKDDIRVWELGNEMENHAIIQPCEMRDDGTQYPCEWGPAGGTHPLDYYGPRWEKVSAALKGMSDGMNAVDPTILKAMGTAGWGHTGAFERMAEDGIDWEISVWHMYGQDPEWAFKELAKYDKPIWVTEFNNPYGSQPGEQRQAEGLELGMQRLIKLQEKYRVEGAHIYQLLDETYWAPSFEASMGLLRLPATDDGGWAVGDPKPAYAVAKRLVRESGPQRECDLDVAASVDRMPERQASYAHCLVLGRDADTAALETWISALDEGNASVSDMVLAMLQSDEFAGRNSTLRLTDQDYVALLFVLLLGREADPHGLDSYATELTSGATTRKGVALGLISSSEFATTHSALFEPGGGTAPPG